MTAALQIVLSALAFGAVVWLAYLVRGGWRDLCSSDWWRE
jgi:hypothetical protein